MNVPSHGEHDTKDDMSMILLASHAPDCDLIHFSLYMMPFDSPCYQSLSPLCKSSVCRLAMEVIAQKKSA